MSTLPARPPRWNLKKADWALFTCASTFYTTALANIYLEQSIEYTIQTIFGAAGLSIPYTLEILPRFSMPWWNEYSTAA